MSDRQEGDICVWHKGEWLPYPIPYGKGSLVLADLAGKAKDAERYRWLRNTPPWEMPIAITSPNCLADDGRSIMFYSLESLDSAVDSALSTPSHGD